MKSTLMHPDTHEARNLHRRHDIARMWKSLFFLATLVGILALTILLINIFNQSIGLVIYDYSINPSELSDGPLEDLEKTELIAILEKHLSANRLRALNREKPLADRSQNELYHLVLQRVADEKVEESYILSDSLFHREQIEQTLQEKYPNGRLAYRMWLTWDFLKANMSKRAETAGIHSALMGSLYLVSITISFALPVGVGAAIYLEEYADKRNWLNRIIQTNIENLAGVPSIIYGILGLAIFVRTFAPITSGQIFGVENSNGRTILSAGLTMGLLILPVLIINAQEAIRAVPNSLRQASFGLGATRWQTIWYHVIPYAMPGILTGAILAMSRAIGETAPLIVVGASTLITGAPSGPFSNFTALPIQIYNWTARAQAEFHNLAAAAIIVLLATLLSMNSIAIILRNRFGRR